MATLHSSPVKVLDDLPMRQAKVHVKKLDNWDQRVGQAIENAISMAFATQTDVWKAMGHNDGSELSRWISGARTADFAKLFSIGWLRKPLVICLAGLVEGIQVETTLRMVV